MSLVSRIYKWRGKAVMSHYAKCRFNELLAVLLFFLAMAIICFMMYLLDKSDTYFDTDSGPLYRMV